LTFVPMVLAIVAGLSPVTPGIPSRTGLPAITWNDNTAPAGTRTGKALTIRLEVVRGRWHVLGPDQPAGEVLAFGEVGKAPSNPGPLLRVPLGTLVQASVTNRHDKPIVVHGLSSRRGATMDSLVIPAGETREVRFDADVEGTFYYWGAEVGTKFDDRVYGDSQLNGAFVVDPVGAAGKPADRILVVTRWVQSKDSDGEPDVWGEFFAINGRPWPLTERFTYDVGDSVHWRWVNASNDVHPLHLHGFYFRVDSRGDVQRDTLYWEGQRRMGVTERVEPGATMAITWSPDRAGGWVFHCHLTWHVTPNAKVGATANPFFARFREVTEHSWHGDPNHHVEQSMGGLMLAINVRPKGPLPTPPTERRVLRLFVTSDTVVKDSTRRFSYVLQEGAHGPAADSLVAMAPTLVLHRGEPTLIRVVNKSPEPTAVHWHGVELESPFDGVVGVGGYMGSPAPAIMPGDSFDVKVTPPRSGSFMYHTHVNDIRQMKGGLWGPLVILEPGQSLDPVRDRVYMVGPGLDTEGWLQGTNKLDSLTLHANQPHRFRFMSVAISNPNLAFRLVREGAEQTWTPVARDGFDLPAHQRGEAPANEIVSVGETRDLEKTFTRPGNYALELRGGNGRGRLFASQAIRVLEFQTEDQQIASAVLPLPETLREGATVLGYRTPEDLVELRKGTNGLVCLADDPNAASFHVACYQEGMEPFMARGRALRRSGVTGEAVDSVRYAEVASGAIPMPKVAALWSVSGGPGSWDAEKNEVRRGRPLYVVYMPFATTATTGLPTMPAADTPWLMFPGTPKAHIMFVPTMP